jgi:hypothetical protein
VCGWLRYVDGVLCKYVCRQIRLLREVPLSGTNRTSLSDLFDAACDEMEKLRVEHQRQEQLLRAKSADQDFRKKVRTLEVKYRNKAEKLIRPLLKEKE